ncbi:MAG TPA: SURF1 family protein [Jatrophihabitans sp.]
MLETLRQRRYLGLFGVMLVVATICLLAGTWQISRFDWKHRTNHELRSNNGDQPASVSAAMGPANAPTATGLTLQFRHVAATGHYLPGHQVLVRGQTVNGDVGYLVLTPFQTDSGVLLIVRGFVPQTATATVTPTVPAAPSSTVTITGRMQPAETKADKFGKLPSTQVESINPADQAARIGQPVWNGYAELLDGQPGSTGMTVIPAPDLSNPAGGADEPQHAAYVVQWYLFAGLALAMPFVLAAAERRRDGPTPTQPTRTTDTAAAGSPQAGRKKAATRKEAKASLDDRLAGKA